jgi:hypothetical protein
VKPQILWELDGWVGHVELSRGSGKSYKTLVGKIKMKRLRKQVCRWQDNIKIKLSQTECACTSVDLSNMVQDKKWRAL